MAQEPPREIEGRSMFAQDSDERSCRVVGQDAVRAERYDARSRAVGEGDQPGEITANERVALGAAAFRHVRSLHRAKRDAASR